MTMDAELNSGNFSAAGETGGQGQSQVCESSVARPLESEPATPAAAADAASGGGSLATGARDEGQAKAVIAQPVEPSVEAEKISLAGNTGRDDQVGDSQVGDSPVAIASSEAAAVDPLGDALAALDRRDYATAQRLFEALGRKDTAEAIKDALAALDRKDYATAQRLFEALSLKGAAAGQVQGSAPATPAPPRPAASAAGPIASDSRDKAQQKPAASAPEVIPFVDAGHRRPHPQAEKAKSRGLKPLLLGTGLVLFAISGAYAIYVSPPNWTLATAKSQASAGLASAVDVLKAPLEAITGRSGREEERSEMRDLRAALAQLTIRLDRIEREHGARLDKLSERVDQDSSSRFADIAARLDKVEKKAAVPATPASEFADVVARLDKLEKRVAIAAAPASEFADITKRLNKLEKRAAVSAASLAKPLPPAMPKQSTLTARAEPSASNEMARPDNPRPLLRDYSVEDVQDGVAVVDSRDGPQKVAPGDFIPGAGRVLRIERRGGDWFVVTSQGVIASGPAPD
jgi:tetrahydromethanopterin S-methyltransferase subunit G